jgi:putative membrane protein
LTFPKRTNTGSLFLWALVAIYAAARVAQAYPEQIPMLVIVAFHVLPPLIFALVHGALRYRPRGIFVFAALSLAIGNLTENLSVLTGLPFGHYHFTGVMGPKLFHVPVLLGPAYIGMGYLSWTLGLIVLGDRDRHLRGSRVVTTPLVAAFIMVAWDLSMDPIWSNLVRAWIWHDGGAYFGVPVSNFLGWYLTVYLIYQSFAIYLQRSSISLPAPPSGHWHMAVLFYGVSALGNLFVIAPPELKEVADAAGTHWAVNGILGASVLVSLFVMGAFTVLAWVRLIDRSCSAPPAES